MHNVNFAYCNKKICSLTKILNLGIAKRIYIMYNVKSNKRLNIPIYLNIKNERLKYGYGKIYRYDE